MAPVAGIACTLTLATADRQRVAGCERLEPGGGKMRVAVSEFISLDGVVQAPGGPDKDTSGGFRTVAGRCSSSTPR